MDKYNFQRNILKNYDIVDELIFFKNEAYIFEPNTYYDNDETELFIFVEWHILDKKNINDSQTLSEYIKERSLIKTTNLEFAEKMKAYYERKLDPEIISYLCKNEKSLISGKFDVSSETSSQYKYLYLYLYYFNDMINELKRIITKFEKEGILKNDQQVNIIFDQDSYLYFGDFDRTIFKFSRKQLILKTININPKPQNINQFEQDILQFELENPVNYLELINTEYLKLGINKAVVVLLSLDQIVREINGKIGSIFSDNVRLYVNNTFVDNSIIKTILQNGEVFQVLHNGISIVCKNAKFGIENIVIEKSSIVNGAQTIFNLIKLIKLGIVNLDYLRGKFVLTKIIEIEDSIKEDTRLIISQAANTQKAINLQDLKSNHEYLIGYKALFLTYKIDLIIKRGIASRYTNRIRIEKFAKIVYSAFCQCPGKARNSSSDNFFDERKPYFQMIFEFKSEMKSDNLRILIFMIYSFYDSYKKAIEEARKTASKYAELYFVSYIFGKILSLEKDLIIKQLDTKNLKISEVGKLVNKYSIEFCSKIKSAELPSDVNLFEVFRSEDLYKSIFTNSDNIKGILKTEFDIDIIKND